MTNVVNIFNTIILTSLFLSYLSNPYATHNDFTDGSFESGNFSSAWKPSDITYAEVINLKNVSEIYFPGNKFVALLRSPAVLSQSIGGNLIIPNTYITQTFKTSNSTLQISFSYIIVCEDNGFQDNDMIQYGRVQLTKTFHNAMFKNVTSTLLLPCAKTSSSLTSQSATGYFNVESNTSYTIRCEVFPNQNDPFKENFGFFTNFKSLDTFEPSHTPTTKPTVFPSFNPTDAPTVCKSQPGDIPLPLLITSSTTGSFFSSTVVCSNANNNTAEACAGSLGQFTPSAASYITSNAVSHHYLNATNFVSTYYDLGPSAYSPSSTFSLGGLSTNSPVGTFVESLCSEISLLLKTPVVYVDDFNIAVVYLARDSIGRLQCSYESVTMTISNGPKPIISVSLVNGGCTAFNNIANPTGKCLYSGTDTSLFTTLGANYSLVVTMTTQSTSISALTSIYFHPQRSNPTAFDSLRVYVYLPQRIVYTGDMLTIPINLYSPLIGIAAGTIDIVYNSSNLKFKSFTSTLYGTGVVTSIQPGGRGVAHLAFIDSLGISNTNAVGNIPVGIVYFTVLYVELSTTSVLQGTLTELGGLAGVTICNNNNPSTQCSNQNVNSGKYFSGGTHDLKFLDMQGAPGKLYGVVAIGAPQVIGLYATSGVSTMVNMIDLNGVQSTDIMIVYATYGIFDASRTSYHDFVVPSSSLSCSLLNGIWSSVISVSTNPGSQFGCKVVAKEGGVDAAAIKASYFGDSITATYRIYSPENFTVVATRRVLRKLSDCPMYESAILKVLTNFYANSSNIVTNVDVTSFLSLTTSDRTVAKYLTNTFTLTGMGPGTVQLITAGTSSKIILNNNLFIISGCIAKISSLYTFAYSSIKSSITTTSIQERLPVKISVSISAPILQGQTAFPFGPSNPQKNYAKLVTYALGDDGIFTDVSQFPGLSIHSLDSNNVNTSISGTGSNLFWYAYVPLNAAATTGNLLVPVLRDTCGTILSQNSMKQGHIYTTAGTPCKATIDGVQRLTFPGACATKSPIDIPVSIQLTSKLYVCNPNSVLDMTSDHRTKYSYVAATGVNISVSKTGFVQVYPNSEVGLVTITVSFPGFSNAGRVNASNTFYIVDILPNLTIVSYDYPGESITPFTSLKEIECSGVYQRASLGALVTLTDGYPVDVTVSTEFSISQSNLSLVTTLNAPYGSGPGRAIAAAVGRSQALVSAKFCSASGSLAIVSGGVAKVTSMSNLLYANPTSQCSKSVYTVSTSSQYGCGASLTERCMPTNLEIVLNDGTKLNYGDLTKLELYAGKLLFFDVAELAYININSSTGAMSAKQNSFEYSSVHVNIYCYRNKTILPISTSLSNVVSNVYPGANDTKLGNLVGLPYIQCPNTNTIQVPIYFYVSKGFYIDAWDVAVYIRNEYLSYKNVIYDNSGATWSPFYPPTVASLVTDSSVSYIHMFSTAVGSTEGNGLVHVADLQLSALSKPIITEITAEVLGLIYSPMGGKSESAQVIIASSTTHFQCKSCSGYIKLNSGQNFDSPIPVSDLSRRTLLQANTTTTQTKNVILGDVNGDGFCDVVDVDETGNLYFSLNDLNNVPKSFIQTKYQIPISQAESAELTYYFMQQCPNNYCGHGDYSSQFILENIQLNDITAISNVYGRYFPILQFLQTGTPCDLVTDLPSYKDPVMKLEAVLYSPKVKLLNNIGGVPLQCNYNGGINYTNVVYFQINIPHYEINFIIGGTFQQNNTHSTVIGPAECRGNGVFALTVGVFNSSLNSTVEYYAASVLVTSHYDSNDQTSFAYGTFNFPSYKDAVILNLDCDSFPSSICPPFYNSSNCKPILPTSTPTFKPSDTPTLVPTFVPTVAPTSCQPTHLPTVSPSTSPSQIPSVEPSFSPSIKPTQFPTPKCYSDFYFVYNHTINYVDHCAQSVNAVSSYLDDVYIETLQYFVNLIAPKLSTKIANLTALSLSVKHKTCEKPYNSSLIQKFKTSYIPSSSPTTNSPIHHKNSNQSIKINHFRMQQVDGNDGKFPDASIKASLFSPQDSSAIPSVAPSMASTKSNSSLTPIVIIPAFPTYIPSQTPTFKPTLKQSFTPTAISSALSLSPNFSHSALPTAEPIVPPSSTPAIVPSKLPSTSPTTVLSIHPSLLSFAPTKTPTNRSSYPTSLFPSFSPSMIPSKSTSSPSPPTDVYTLLSSIQLQIEFYLRVTPYNNRNITSILCSSVFQLLGEAVLSGVLDQKLQQFASEHTPPVEAFKFSRSGGIQAQSCPTDLGHTHYVHTSLPTMFITPKPTFSSMPLATPSIAPSTTPSTAPIATDASTQSVSLTTVENVIIPVVVIAFALLLALLFYSNYRPKKISLQVTDDDLDITDVKSIFEVTMDRLYIETKDRFEEKKRKFEDSTSGGPASLFTFDELRKEDEVNISFQVYPSMKHLDEITRFNDRPSFQPGNQLAPLQRGSTILAPKDNTEYDLVTKNTKKMFILVLGYILNNSLSILPSRNEVDYYLLKKPLKEGERDLYMYTFKSEDFFDLWNCLHKIAEVIFDLNKGYLSRLESKYVAIHRLSYSVLSVPGRKAFYQGPPQSAYEAETAEMLMWIEALNDIINEFFIDHKELFNDLELCKIKERGQNRELVSNEARPSETDRESNKFNFNSNVRAYVPSAQIKLEDMYQDETNGRITFPYERSELDRLKLMQPDGGLGTTTGRREYIPSVQFSFDEAYKSRVGDRPSEVPVYTLSESDRDALKRSQRTSLHNDLQRLQTIEEEARTGEEERTEERQRVEENGRAEEEEFAETLEHIIAVDSSTDLR